MLDLPLHVVKPGLAAISKSILTDGKLPAHEAVHLEEILNSFTFRLTGTAAIARSTANHWHPDSRENGSSVPLATLSTEMIACPCKPSSTLLLISLRNGQLDAKSGELKVAYHANTNNVFHYRLLGFTGASPPSAGRPSAPLAANSVITLAIEIEPFKPGTELGSLVWSAGGNAAPEIQLIHPSDAAPSDDARLAALVCTYSQWLSGDPGRFIDADLVSALAREIASSTLSDERADFLRLIEQSLHL